MSVKVGDCSCCFAAFHVIVVTNELQGEMITSKDFKIICRSRGQLLPLSSVYEGILRRSVRVTISGTDDKIRRNWDFHSNLLSFY